ncbi:putative RNase H-like HicB family nuclease [Desulfosalsimonas propionicica]|uniref:Putative RNase H-like HicB family nuclease n=1 Tax=Desulfosalsimonas propionicica TaxID=332175 RepID=A0A7W0C6N5_9BACT|nr:type II toxin-antitoxin system HicB family antitoxin [Desulfosalsimonas propionicica]MBA2880184.1 putative RNase H-like HicB family nuclease [Desulfosalsimonas propionicica]
MSKLEKLSEHILMRRSNANVSFETLCSLEKKYEIIIFWSSEDNSFVAEVPELPGCMADGKTYQEALSNAEQIIDEWIETATRLGRPIPQPKGRLAYA